MSVSDIPLERMRARKVNAPDVYPHHRVSFLLGGTGDTPPTVGATFE